MTKDELIVRLCLELEEKKKTVEEQESCFEEAKEHLEEIKGRFVSIGQPLNDNILQMNNEQLKWCQEVYDRLEDIEF